MPIANPNTVIREGYMRHLSYDIICPKNTWISYILGCTGAVENGHAPKLHGALVYASNSLYNYGDLTCGVVSLQHTI